MFCQHSTKRFSITFNGQWQKYFHHYFGRAIDMYTYMYLGQQQKNLSWWKKILQFERFKDLLRAGFQSTRAAKIIQKRMNRRERKKKHMQMVHSVFGIQTTQIRTALLEMFSTLRKYKSMWNAYQFSLSLSVLQTNQETKRAEKKNERTRSHEGARGREKRFGSSFNAK